MATLFTMESVWLCSLAVYLCGVVRHAMAEFSLKDVRGA